MATGFEWAFCEVKRTRYSSYFDTIGPVEVQRLSVHFFARPLISSWRRKTAVFLFRTEYCLCLSA
jgi:hypothetical protein